jgi:hypothetical protein
MRHIFFKVTAGIIVFALMHRMASAEMGPCMPDDQGGLTCGGGVGAAQVILKTRSPSKRLAFAWRLTDRPPTNKPLDNDSNLENFIVRIEDGAVLAKSRGTYWDLSTKIAKAYLFTAWSPDSRLLVKVQQSAESSSAELFTFTEDDSAAGAFELVNVVKPAMLAKIRDSRYTADDLLIFASHPAMAIDGDGVLHVAAFLRSQQLLDSPPYEVTVQLGQNGESLDAKVVAITESPKPTVSVIVH